MTPAQIANLRGLLAKATPGEWKQLLADDADFLDALQKDAEAVTDRVAGLIYVREGGAHGLGKTLLTVNARRATLDIDQANAQLIVAAINALPALLDAAERVERLTDMLARLVGAAAEVADFLGEEDYPGTQRVLDGLCIAARAFLAETADGGASDVRR